MRYKFLISILMLFLCAAAWGAPHPLEVAMDKCMEEDPSTRGVSNCAADFKEKWDDELNRAYKELMGMMPKEGQDLLRNAQRAWIPWRDNEFKLLKGVYDTIIENSGGSMFVTVWAIADMEVVKKRTLELLAYTGEMKEGKPAFKERQPATDSDTQLTEAMKVKNNHKRVGKELSGDGAEIAEATLKTWEDFRNKEVAFMAWFYSKGSDRAFPLHGRMEKNMDRNKALDLLYADLTADYLGESDQEDEPGVKVVVKNAGSAGKEPYKGDRTLYRPDEGKCDFGAYIIDPDPKGANVRDGPNGKIITTLPHQPDDPEPIMVKVTGYKGKWLSVILHDGKEGWIFSELVGMSLRNYAPGAVAALRVRPDPNSPTVGDIFEDEQVTVLGGEGEWALVHYRHPRGHEFIGWLDPEKQCGHPYSTCP